MLNYSGHSLPLNFNEDGELQVNDTDHLQTTTADFSGAQSDAILINPAAGKMVEIHSVFVSTTSKVADIILEFLSSTIVVFRQYTTNASSANSSIIHLEGAVDENLTITCPADTFVAVTWHEK